MIAPIIAEGPLNSGESEVLLPSTFACTVVVDTGVDGNVTDITKAA